MDSSDVYRDEARRNGVPEHAIDLALSLARPQIELGPSSEGGGILAGRYGGLPSLPPDSTWDGYLDFVASVDCAALPRDALDIPLPGDGHLLFFADRSDVDGAVLIGKGNSVVHVPAGTATVEKTPDRGGAFSTIDPHPLHARTVRCLPASADDAVLGDVETARLYMEYELEHQDRRREIDGIGLFLGGYAYSPQDPPITGSSPDDEKGGWVLLAQARLDMPDAPGFTACPFWIIQRDELAAMNFGAAGLVTLTYR